jgi:hypothetical protein
MLPKLKVQPDGGDPHRPALLVVCGIRNVLEIKACEESRE